MDAWSRLELIRWKLVHGELPRDGAARIWAGYGRGEDCTACGLPISREDVEYELEFPQSSPRVVRLHRGCCEVWNTERVTFMPVRRSRAVVASVRAH